MEGPLPGLAKAWNAATRAVKRLADAIQPVKKSPVREEELRPTLVSEPDPHVSAPPVSEPPATVRRVEHHGVAISPIVAVGKPSSQDDKSFVREWLAGSKLDVERPQAPQDVVAWLSSDPPPREETLQFGIESLSRVDEQPKRKKQKKPKRPKAAKKAAAKRSGPKPPRKQPAKKRGPRKKR